MVLLRPQLTETMNPPQISSDTEDYGGLGVFVVCQERTLLCKYSNKISKDSRREKATEEVE